MPAIFRHELIVAHEAIDEQGHINNLEYVRWMQDAAIAHSDARGWDSHRYLELGAGWVARSHWIEYLQPGFEGDTLVVYTWISRFRHVRSVRKYKIIRPSDETTLAVAETNWIFVELDGYTPRRVPQELTKSFIIVPPENEP